MDQVAVAGVRLDGESCVMIFKLVPHSHRESGGGTSYCLLTLMKSLELTILRIVNIFGEGGGWAAL